MFTSAPGRSPVGATNPSTSSGALAAAAWTCATRLALTAPSSGYSIVNSREMLDWEQPNSSPATSWELLWRNRNSVSTTARYRPMTLGRPTGRCHTPTRAATAVTRSVTCSWARPVIRSHRGGRPSVISLVHTTQVIYRRTAVVTRSDTPRFDHSGQSGVLNNAPGHRAGVQHRPGRAAHVPGEPGTRGRPVRRDAHARRRRPAADELTGAQLDRAGLDRRPGQQRAAGARRRRAVRLGPVALGGRAGRRADRAGERGAGASGVRTGDHRPRDHPAPGPAARRRQPRNSRQPRNIGLPVSRPAPTGRPRARRAGGTAIHRRPRCAGRTRRPGRLARSGRQGGRPT